MAAHCNYAWGQCYKSNTCSQDGWDYGLGGALYLANKAMVFLSAVQFESNFESIATSVTGGTGSDIWVADSDSTLVCTAGCTTTGMYMPDGVCTTLSTAASVHGGSCAAHCSTAESDCAICGGSECHTVLLQFC